MIHTIDKESSVIGALYSMGYVKKELLKHFMILPMLVVTVSAMLGTGLGFMLISENIKESVAYYSYPDYTTVFPPYLLIYGVLLPMLIALLVNYTVINSGQTNVHHDVWGSNYHSGRIGIVFCDCDVFTGKNND